MKELTSEQEDFLLEEARERDWGKKDETKVVFSFDKKKGLAIERVMFSPSSMEVKK